VNVLVVLPTYNEQLNVERMLREIRRNLPDAAILVVDDGSPDGTAGIVRGLASEIGSLEVLERAAKSGLGSAYRDGFKWGIERGYDAFVEIDADFSHDPAALPSLLAAATAGADVVIGSRYVAGGHIPDWSWHRKLLSWGGNKYASLMLGLGVHDSTAGFRVYRAALLERIDYRSVEADGYGFQIEMTYRSRRAGATITEVPISFVDRALGESKMSSSIIVEALRLVTRWGAQRLVGKGWQPTPLPQA
jgi:dolichol-phosphate mannosyltransferase